MALPRTDDHAAESAPEAGLARLLTRLGRARRAAGAGRAWQPSPPRQPRPPAHLVRRPPDAPSDGDLHDWLGLGGDRDSGATFAAALADGAPEGVEVLARPGGGAAFWAQVFVVPVPETALPARAGRGRHPPPGRGGSPRALPPARGAGPADQQRGARVQQLPPDPDRLHRRAEAPSGRPRRALHPARHRPLHGRGRARHHPDPPTPRLLAPHRARCPPGRPEPAHRSVRRPDRPDTAGPDHPGDPDHAGARLRPQQPDADRTRPEPHRRQCLRGHAGPRAHRDRDLRGAPGGPRPCSGPGTAPSASR